WILGHKVAAYRCCARNKAFHKLKSFIVFQTPPSRLTPDCTGTSQPYSRASALVCECALRPRPRESHRLEWTGGLLTICACAVTAAHSEIHFVIGTRERQKQWRKFTVSFPQIGSTHLQEYNC